ncbi:HNH endonuclease [Chloroflexota bacterium]
MAISQRDIKLLWGRAAGKCSFHDCKIKLSQDKNRASDSFPLGEQAHIVGENKNAARGKSPLTTKERDSYFNLILLCPTHHTIIDNDPEDYPIEKLHIMKAQHELWVEEKFSESKDLRETAQDVIYADLIDTAAEACQFDSWDKWASRALSTNMNWDEDAHKRLFEFYNKIIGAVWPRTLPELECALKKLTYEIYEAIQTFAEHYETSKTRDNILVEERFHKSQGWIEDDNEYQQLFDEYKAWHDKCENHVIEATKAANWLADVVRRDVNPLFFATKGKFFVIMGPYDILTFRSLFFEYTEEEKKEILRLCEQGWKISKDFSKESEDWK